MSSHTIISTQCQFQGHTVCPRTIHRARAGVLPGIRYTHHPNPLPGESLLITTHYCACPCHKGTIPEIQGTTPPADPNQ